MTELTSTPIPVDEQRDILTADRKALPCNAALAKAIDEALAALDKALNALKPD